MNEKARHAAGLFDFLSFVVPAKRPPDKVRREREPGPVTTTVAIDRKVSGYRFRVSPPSRKALRRLARNDRY